LAYRLWFSIERLFASDSSELGMSNAKGMPDFHRDVRRQVGFRK